MSAAPIGPGAPAQLPAPVVMPATEVERPAPVDYALAYAAHGWPVFPIEPIRNGACACGRPHGKGKGFCETPGKHPIGTLVQDGHKSATTDPEAIRHWWTVVPDAHVGLRLDTPGLVAVDVDPRNGGDPSLLPFDIDQTLNATTGGGGRHAVYRVPAGMEPLKTAPWPGVDLKYHGYIVVEPSGHLSGGRYAWRDWDVLSGEVPEILQAPGELLKLIGSQDAAATFGTELINERQIADLRATLATFSSDDRVLWIAVGYALASIRNEGVGFTLWDEWSRKSDKYDANDQARRWNGFTGTRSDWRAVFSIAQQNGGQIVTTPIDADFKLQIFETIINGLAKQAQAAATSAPAPGALHEREPMFKPVGDPFVGLDNPAWIVEGYLERVGVSLTFGEPASGKSFVGFSWAACVGSDTPWMGRRVRRGAVFIIAGEGERGIKRRLAAWSKKYEVNLKDAPIFFTERSVGLIDLTQALEVAADIATMCAKHEVEPALVIVDTLSRNLGDGDENAASDITQFFNHLNDEIARKYRCHVAVIHHSGHGQGRARGSSAIKAAVDQEYRVASTAGHVVFSCTKMKDAPVPPDLNFQIEQIEVGINVDGDPIGGAVLVIEGNLFDMEVCRDKNRKPVTARMVMAVLARKGWPGEVAMMAEFDIGTDKTVRNAMGRMKDAGMVEKKGKKWVPTEKALDQWSRTGGLLPALQD